MKKTFSTRRVPRKVGQEDDEVGRDGNEGETASKHTPKRPSSKPRKSSSLRTSFGPSALEDEDSERAGVVTPKRSNLSRIAIQRNAGQRSSTLYSTPLSRGLEDDDDAPSYTAASLQELKDSTPATPQDLTTDTSNSEVEDVERSTQALDLTSKFDSSLARYNQSSAIPSASEIAEKKARRARLAKEQTADEYISLNPSDPELSEPEDENVTRDDSGRLILKPKDKYAYAESRLVRDDEDIMENFDEFTEADGKILLGRKAEAEEAKKRKKQMASQIAEAEASDSDDSDTSERERNEAFEAAQTKHGTYGSHNTSNEPYANARPRTPPTISPLPTLDGVIERLRKQLSDMQTSRMRKLQEMEALQREKIRLGEEEVRIQKALKETAEKFQQLRAERRIAAKQSTPALYVAGSMAVEGDSGASTDIEGHVGSGFGGMAGRGLESIGASGVGTPVGGGSDDEMAA